MTLTFDKYAEDIQIKKMTDAGISAYAVAKALGRSKSYVLNRLPELSFLSFTNIDKILLLGREGHSVKVIAQRTSTDACTVVYHLRMNDVPVDNMEVIAPWLYSLGHPLSYVRAASGYSYEKLSSLLEAAGIETRVEVPTPIDNEDFFSLIDTPEKAYWLGFICADGNVSNDGKYIQIKLHSRDHGHLLKFSDVLGYHGNVNKYSAVTNYGAYEFSQIIVRSDRLNADLVKHGCVPNKSKWLEPPTGVKNSLFPHFLRGMTDGDGSLVLRSGEVRGIKLYGVQKIAHWAAEVMPGGKVRQHSGQTWEVQWNSTETVRKLYESSTENSRLDRKYEKVQGLMA